MGFILTILEGQEKGRHFRFDQDKVLVGRVPENDLVLYEGGVSRVHCEIVRQGDDYILRDMNSANGTYLNDRETKENKLKQADQIEVGPIIFSFSTWEEHATSPAVGDTAHLRPDNTIARQEIEAKSTVAFRPEDLEELAQVRQARRTLLQKGKRAKHDSPKKTRLISKFIQHFTSMPLSLKLVWVFLSMLTLLFWGMAWQGLQEKASTRTQHNIFALVVDTAALSFGAGKVDHYNPHGVGFRFEYRGGRTILRCSVKDIVNSHHIQILLNGHEVAFLARSAGWTRGLLYALPLSLLKRGENILEFKQTAPKEPHGRWVVSQISIRQESLPPPDLPEAKRLFELAKATYETRSVAPQNLYKSITYFEQGLLHLAQISPPPTLRTSIEAALTEAEKSLKAIHSRYIFSVQKAKRFGRYAEAKEALEALLSYYPEPSDPRHTKLQSDLRALREP
jgi:hypothetical protein